MRFTSSLATCLAVLASSAELTAASIAYVLTFDPHTANGKHQIAIGSLPAEIARLVLAQRAGVEDYHTTTSVPSDAEIEVINKYGAKSSMLSTGRTESKAFLLAELPEEHDSHTKLRLHARFTIQNPPDLASSKELFRDLYTQSHKGSTLTIKGLESESFDSSADSPVFHVASDANALVKLARKLAAEKTSVTALLVPAGSRSSGWGTYSMPGSTGKVEKRQSSHRGFDPEEPLAEAFEDAMAATKHLDLAASDSSNSSSNHSNSEPLKGIFPACFRSESACDKQTRGCTGHGKCQLKFTNKDHPGSAKNKGECWSCVCASPKTGKGSSTKWAGPACQKKDISAEFWLIALFTIGLVGLISFAVGNLLSMGNQELPSVIGAGVSGPTARK